jgi:hypothetical protein
MLDSDTRIYEKVPLLQMMHRLRVPTLVKAYPAMFAVIVCAVMPFAPIISATEVRTESGKASAVIQIRSLLREITPLSKDAAVAIGRWELKRAEDRPHGRFTLILRRLPEGWRIVLDHTSAAP